MGTARTCSSVSTRLHTGCLQRNWTWSCRQHRARIFYPRRRTEGRWVVTHRRIRHGTGHSIGGARFSAYGCSCRCVYRPHPLPSLPLHDYVGLSIWVRNIGRRARVSTSPGRRSLNAPLLLVCVSCLAPPGRRWLRSCPRNCPASRHHQPS